jgi:hypothetical protein
MPSPNAPLELVLSIAVAVGTIVAAYMLTRRGVKATIKAQDQIEAIKRAQAADGVTAADLPAGFTATDYDKLLAKIAADVRLANPAVSSLMRSYHEQALEQARTQFKFGIVAAMIGFAYILVRGVFVADIAGAPAILPGAIVEVVAVLFLRESREIRQRATDFYDRLQSYDRQLESVTLVRSIQDVRLQGAAQAFLALHMAGAPTTDALTVLSHSDHEAAVSPKQPEVST